MSGKAALITLLSIIIPIIFVVGLVYFVGITTNNRGFVGIIITYLIPIIGFSSAYTGQWYIKKNKI